MEMTSKSYLSLLQVVRDLAGYSYGRSDLVRRAMSKKKMDVMEEEREYFINGKLKENGEVEIKGCIRNGISKEAANQIYDDMIDFAKYAFNKSHAASYGVLAYQTAYLKTYYPVEFMAALITSVMGNTDKVAQYIKECENMEIKVLAPSVNKSFGKFSVEEGNIRYGMAAIKNVGAAVIENIVKERSELGEFTDFIDFCKRLDQKDLNKRLVESLIKAGAFDEFNENRAQILGGFEGILESISNDRKKNVQGQISLFEMPQSDSTNIKQDYELKEVIPFSEKEKLFYEKEVLGIYITGHPLKDYQKELQRNSSINTAEIFEHKDDYESMMQMDNQTVIIGGIISNKNIKATRSNNMMAFLTLEDIYGEIEIVVFPKILQKYSPIIQEDQIIYVRGRLSIKEDDEPKIIAEDIKAFEEIKEAKNLCLIVNGLEDPRLETFLKLAKKSHGNDKVFIKNIINSRVYKYNHISGVNTNDEMFLKEIMQLFGEEKIIVK